MFELSQSFHFDAAHTLERLHETVSSRRLHGHSYHAEVTLAGEPDPGSGMVADLALLRGVIAELRGQLDHHLLDEVPGLAPATLENLCRYMHAFVAARLPGVVQVSVARPSSGDRCVYRPGR
ncbi:6-carboxytetrahydropterin synthase [Aquincola sp. S2]|uniref:6-carboxy-5,6,7,8-tetrahydropterin synthase n=1 Tax=Pseudaquabacterium terrae TaxID=2732868 RepID=A0ABX2EDE0_9BURK|nr:6-carboxytetrahydropterin synthase [Aquabacterium terrae]NRF66047.1 6-carboxytetrahydropterin synthase [Aquabacterium terrae]